MIDLNHYSADELYELYNKLRSGEWDDRLGKVSKANKKACIDLTRAAVHRLMGGKNIMRMDALRKWGWSREQFDDFYDRQLDMAVFPYLYEMDDFHQALGNEADKIIGGLVLGGLDVEKLEKMIDKRRKLHEWQVESFEKEDRKKDRLTIAAMVLSAGTIILGILTILLRRGVIKYPRLEYPPWIQPTGAHDAYSEGAKVSHDGKRWISTAKNNTWAPGVYGWKMED